MITNTSEDIISRLQSVIGGRNIVQNAEFSGSTNGWSSAGMMTATAVDGGVYLLGDGHFYQTLNTTDVPNTTLSILRVKCSGISGTITALVGETYNDSTPQATMTLVNGWNSIRFTASTANIISFTGASTADYVTIEEVWEQEQKDLVVTGQIRNMDFELSDPTFDTLHVTGTITSSLVQAEDSTATANSLTVRAGNGTFPLGTGGDLTLSAGTAGISQDPGNISITTGAGGAGKDGGDISITTGGGGTFGHGGDLTITLGDGQDADNGGDFYLTAGDATDTTPGSPRGGNIVLTSGTGGTASGTIQLIGDTQITGDVTVNGNIITPAMPTSNPGAGILWNNGGVVNVGT